MSKHPSICKVPLSPAQANAMSYGNLSRTDAYRAGSVSIHTSRPCPIPPRPSYIQREDPRPCESDARSNVRKHRTRKIARGPGISARVASDAENAHEIPNAVSNIGVGEQYPSATVHAHSIDVRPRHRSHGAIRNVGDHQRTVGAVPVIFERIRRIERFKTCAAITEAPSETGRVAFMEDKAAHSG